MQSAAAVRQHVLSSYNILDTAAEPEFDDIVAIAQRVCDTKVALVSLVGNDRQWFKARIGLQRRETPLEESVCVHALQEEEMLVIPDLTRDSRTSSNALVTGDPFIRFYAGAVLRSPEGIAIGSLCVIDDQPRAEGLTSVQANVLKALARQVMALMALRRAVTDRDGALLAEHAQNVESSTRARHSEQVNALLLAAGDRQVQAQEVGGIGTFEIDVTTNRVVVSAEFRRLFGISATSEVTIDDVQSFAAEAGDPHQPSVDMRKDDVARHEVEYRVQRANDGATRWILRRTGYHTTPAGDVDRMIGTVQDITDRKLGQLRTQALIEIGDTARAAETVDQAIIIAARVIGTVLEVARTGFARVDTAEGILRIERDWTAEGHVSLAGLHSIEAFRNVIGRATDGAPVVIADVPAASWLAEDRAGLAALDIKALINVPFLHQGQLAGLFFVHSAIPRTWSADETDFVIAAADRAYATVARLEAEAHQRVLNDELSHRLKNTLSLVQAIIAQTLRGVAERHVVSALEDRIIALSKAHDVLLQQNWSAARIAAVVEKVLDVHGEEGAFRISGPNFLMGAKATLSISLLLHEMSTNALKYGALSVDGGIVSIAWQVEDADAQRVLKLTWTETGGPPAVAPARRGFGSRLIAMGIAGAGLVELDYAQTGLRAGFTAPFHLISDS